MTQLLPKDETFEAPDWINPDVGVASSPPWYYWYVGFNLAARIDPAVHSTYPFRVGGTVGTLGTSCLMIPESDTGISIPALMTDPLGSTLANTHRGILARSDPSFSYDERDIKISFAVTGGTIGGSLGLSAGGGANQSPTRLGYIEYPASPVTSGNNFTTMSNPKRGSWETGGGMSAMGSDSSMNNPWPAWRGNAVIFRAGGGVPLAEDGGVSSDTLVERAWYYSACDHYAFVAYPQVGVAVPDLYFELWQVKYTDNGGSGSTANVPRRLLQQTVTGGAAKFDFREPFDLRVKVKNDATPDVLIECFASAYIDLNGDTQGEVQCFKNDVFPNNTYAAPGTSVTHTSATGVVKDAHTDKISAFADKTIGFVVSRERVIDVADQVGSSTPVQWGCHYGVYFIETRGITDDTVDYRDEFKRVVNSSGFNGASSVVMPLTTTTGIAGVQANGMLTLDSDAAKIPMVLSDLVNIDLVRRLALWTDGITDTTVPNDYLTLDYDGDAAATGGNEPYLVHKSFVYLRPSTQFFNHDRSISFTPGAETGVLSTMTYELAVNLRGSFDGWNTQGVTAFVRWRTNGSGTIEYGQVAIANRNHDYTSQTVFTTGQELLASKTWSAGVADGMPNLYSPGTPSGWNTLGFSVTAYPQGPTPASIASYKVKLNGVPLELDDTGNPLTSATTTPFAVTESAPYPFSGRSEGFAFMASQPEINAGGARLWNPPIVKDWVEGVLPPDPGGGSNPDDQATITVSGEGTPVGSLNASGGALALSGGGVWDVSTTVSVEDFRALVRHQFDSGHAYSSPMYGKRRRRWRVMVTGMTKDLYQSLQSFFNSHYGMQIPFTFVLPILNDGSQPGSTAGTIESVSAYFGEDTLNVVEVTPNQYDAAMSIEELVVA